MYNFDHSIRIWVYIMQCRELFTITGFAMTLTLYEIWTSKHLKVDKEKLKALNRKILHSF